MFMLLIIYAYHMTRVGPITITYFKQRYNKWALVIKVVENDASCGTS